MNFKKTIARILIKTSFLGLMASLFLMTATTSQFSDIETAKANTVKTGTLDLGLRSGQSNFVSGADSMEPGNSVARDIYVQNLGNNPFQYKTNYEYVSGDKDLCAGLQLKVWYNWYESEPPSPGDHSTRHMDLKYSGPLTDFDDFDTNSPVHDPDMVLPNSHPYYSNVFYQDNEHWFYYQVTLPSGTGYLLDKICTFNIKVKGWQVGLAEADSGFWDEEIIQSTIGTQRRCGEGEEAIDAAPIDRVNIGDSLSEDLHDIDGWSPPNMDGNYGGKDDGTYRQIIENTSCNEDGREAKFVLYAGARKAQLLRIRHLDGLSNLDSFEIYVNDNLVGTYTDIQDSAEIWHDLEIPLDNLSGRLEVKLKAINNIWSGCPQFGQVAVSWAEIDGYYCSPDKANIPAPVEPVCQSPQTPTIVDLIDNLNIGDIASESAHSMLGWSTVNLPGNYGDKDDGTYRQIISEQYCSDEYRIAGFTLNTGSNIANLLKLRVLDGISNKDGLDVYVNDEFMAHLPDLTQNHPEQWQTYEIPLPNLSGEIKVRLVGFDSFWNLCSTYGQVSVSWASMAGYKCSSEQQPSIPDVVINEVMWMGSHESTADEWIELKNTTASLIDLTGWSIERAGSGSNAITLSGSIPAGGYFLLSNYSSLASSINDSITVDQVAAGIALDNSGEQLILRNSSGAIIDQTPDGSWPMGVNGTGDNPDRSMERNDGSVDGSNPASWHTCVDSACNDTTYWDVEGNNYGTPKAANLSDLLDTGLDLWISENKHEVSFRVSNVSPWEKLQYFITYDSESGPQGIGPSDVVINGVDVVERNGLVLGTCSSLGEVCVYHQGIIKINISITLTGSNMPDRILEKSLNL